MIARNLSRKYAPEYDPASGITRTPLLLLQAPPAPDERRFYLHILAAVGAPATALSARAQNVASLEVRVIALLRDLGLRMIMIDEVHNLLAGTHREQRRFLNVLRYLSNELEVSLVCLGVSEAVDAIRGDIQLARRLDEHHLPNWRDDAEFSDMIQTLIAAMPLEKKSNLKVKALKQILALTGGVTSRIFALIKDLSIDAIVKGDECITDDAIAKWTPVWSRHANAYRRARCRKLSRRCQTSCCQVGYLGWRRPTTAMTRNCWLISKSIPRMAPPWTSASTRLWRRRLPTQHDSTQMLCDL